jgi:glycosyltransferase involved in cell wall biosynthesis
MPITVMYDIAQLGYGHVYSYYRTGIHRVIEQVALGLRECPDVNLLFCASEAGAFAAAYAKESNAFPSVPLDYDRVLSFMEKKQLELTKRIERSHGSGFFHRVARRSLFEAAKLWTISGQKVPCPAGVDLYHSQYYPIPKNILANRKMRRVLTVHDIIPIKLPNFVLTGCDEKLRNAIMTLGRNDWVICDSECTRQDLLEFRKDLNPDRVTVVYLAAMDTFRPSNAPSELRRVRARYGIPDGPYILSLSTIEIRKNIDMVIRAYGNLARKGQLRGVSLVLAGHKGWKDGAIFDAMSKFPELGGRIILTGFVDDKDLPALYSGAMLFAFPSFYEGFGLPVLEAMKCGVPVVCSNASSLPEIAGNACLMVDPTSEKEMTEAILGIFESETLRNELSAKGLAKAEQFSWAKTVAQTVSVYKRAVTE